MKIPKKVEYIVVGGGLVGLQVFQRLIQQGKEVILIEKAAQIGGTALSFKEKGGFGVETLIWSKSKLDGFIYNTEYKEPLTFGKKGLIPFVGFGDKVEAEELLNAFTSEKLEIAEGVNIKSIEQKVFTHTQITSFHRIEDQKNYTLFELNGKDYVEAENIIWTASTREFESLLPKDGFSTLKQKIKKEKGMDALTVQFEISKEELGKYAENRFVFMGDESYPWLGAHTLKNKLVFVSYFNKSLSLDHDFIRRHIKQLKKDLLKAFPESFEESFMKFHGAEKMIFHTSAVSSFNPAMDNFKLKDLANMYILSSQKNFGPDPFEEKWNQVQALF